MSSVTPTTSSKSVAASDVAERLRSLQLGETERKTAEFGLRGIIWLVLISLIIGGVWWVSQNEVPELQSVKDSLRQWMPGGKTKWEVVPVRVEGGEEVLLDLTGYITPKHKVNVSARVPGLLLALNFDEGQTVEAGAELARLDDTTFRADFEQASAAQLVAESRLLEMKNGALPEELEQARTAVEQARGKVTLVEKELARMEQLKQDIPAAEWDQLEAAVSDAKANHKNLEQKLKLLESGPREERMRAAEAEVAQTKAMVAKAQVLLSNTVITAPMTGVILERHGAVGEHIRPEALAAGIYVVADLSQLEVQVDVEEQSLGKLRVGQPCRIIPDAYSDRSYAAKISRWQPQVNRARAVVRVVLTIDSPDDLLLAEMNCRAVILASPASPQPETLWIPATGVVMNGEQPTVFIVADGVAQQRVVKVGETKENQVQIVEGLVKTDQVVLPGPQPPVEGQSVK